jgi:hypothetical protein
MIFALSILQIARVLLSDHANYLFILAIFAVLCVFALTRLRGTIISQAKEVSRKDAKNRKDR